MKSTFSAWRYLWKSEDIRKKLLITLGLLVIYRLAANVPVPGINADALASMRANMGASGTFFDFLDLLSGGTVSSFSLLSMGVYPYITAQIIIQLMVPIIPALQKRMQDDPREGKKWMEKWTYYLAVPMAGLSAFGQINIFNNISVQAGSGLILNFGFSPDIILPSIAMLLSMIAGTMFAIWLGELISEFGVRGQGLSLIIFAGIVSKMPSNVRSIMADEQNRVFLIIFTVLLIVLTIFAIVYVQQGRRNVPVMYPGRRMGNRMSMPVKGSLPLMVNMSGMIPLIFASAFLQFPAIIASYFANSTVEWVKNLSISVTQIFGGTSWVYWLLYFLMVVGFTFFYTDVLFAQQNYGDNLKKMGAQIPGVNRGAPTQKYLTKVQRRVTLPGALFLGIIAILPFLVQLLLPVASQTSGLFLVSSAGLLIVVGVVRDLFLNIDAELQLHGYDDSLLVR
ncbi:preprotein translocase subunit SecY [Chloroflexota bacterium]